MTDTLPPLRDVIEKHDLMARKKLGQNFLLDLNLTGRIARAAGDLADGCVIEVGPGPGGLTRAILGEGAKQVFVIERDDRCLPVLAEISAAYPGQLEVVSGDALKVDVSALGKAPRRIVANLPYNVATPLLIGWLRQFEAFDVMVLMFQKEVVDRLQAQPGNKHYGRLSVIAQWLCHVEALFDVNPRAFIPPPKVVSTVARFTPRPQPLAPARMETLEKVTAAAFGQRRKMLRSSLKALGDSLALCEMAGIDPTRRAETIDIEGFCALANAVDELAP